MERMSDEEFDKLLSIFKGLNTLCWDDIKLTLQEAKRAREAEFKWEKSFENISNQCCELLDTRFELDEQVDKLEKENAELKAELASKGSIIVEPFIKGTNA